MKHRQVCLFCVVAFLATAFGCGPGNPLGREAVSGTVAVDGLPLPRGSINFLPKNREGSVRTGAVIADGKFDLPVEKGLPPGEYVVSILAVERTENPDPNAPPGAEPFTRPKRQMIPSQYNFKSKLVREVKTGEPNVFEFDIKTK